MRDSRIAISIKPSPLESPTMTTLLALANDLSQRAEVVRLVAQDLDDPETVALATAAWAISIELERAAEAVASAGRAESMKPCRS